MGMRIFTHGASVAEASTCRVLHGVAANAPKAAGLLLLLQVGRASHFRHEDVHHVGGRHCSLLHVGLGGDLQCGEHDFRADAVLLSGYPHAAPCRLWPKPRAVGVHDCLHLRVVGALHGRDHQQLQRAKVQDHERQGEATQGNGARRPLCRRRNSPDHGHGKLHGNQVQPVAPRLQPDVCNHEALDEDLQPGGNTGSGVEELEDLLLFVCHPRRVQGSSLLVEEVHMRWARTGVLGNHRHADLAECHGLGGHDLLLGDPKAVQEAVWENVKHAGGLHPARLTLTHHGQQAVDVLEDARAPHDSLWGGILLLDAAHRPALFVL
mmetsp:Transcript_85742/g.227857  ORF Transcript_85742/g.227857 Transcript_85742/m.227857 type:complete len:322 (+) Transcript_85742:220-1185(+)